MNKIIITADSTFDMTPKMAADLGIEVIASYVSMGGDNIFDYPDVTMYDLFAYHDKSGCLPKTAAASPWDYTEFFKKYEDEGVSIIHIAKSSGMSACRDNAQMGAEQVKGVTVFDSLSISGGSALMAAEASRLREQGLDAEALVKSLEKYRSRVAGAFIIEELDYLHKGGRCSGLAHFGANILKLRPQIIIKDGVMGVGKKYRGKFEKCITELVDDVLSGPFEGDEAYISHTILDGELLERSVEYVRKKGGFKKVTVLEAGSAVSCHCGPNTFGLFWLKKQ